MRRVRSRRGSLAPGSDEGNEDPARPGRALYLGAAAVAPGGLTALQPRPLDALGLRRLHARAPLRLEQVVGADDLLHERVADDVHLAEVAERDTLDAAQHALDLDEPRR